MIEDEGLVEPRAIGSPPGAYKIAIEVLAKADAEKVLDCPAGEGLFSSILLRNGYDVAAGDFCPGQFKLTEIICDFVDLNDQIPYADNMFDAVTCLNGLQRVWARGRAISELARVTRPGGIIIISFPNNSDIRRRLMFFLTGSVTWNVIGPPHICLPDAENPTANYRYSLTLANVLSAISSVGLESESIFATHYTKGALVLSPLMLFPILFSKLPIKKYKNVYDRELFKIRENSSLKALLGAFLVVIAKKTA